MREVKRGRDLVGGNAPLKSLPLYYELYFVILIG
jgi:hypothetical protein